MSNLVNNFFFFFFLILIACQLYAFPGQGNMKATSQGNVSASSTIKGSVTETMNSGGYTYLCLEKDGQKKWAAIPESQVNVGDEVEISQGMVMNNFTSKSLDRTFEAIIFSGGIVNR